MQQTRNRIRVEPAQPAYFGFAVIAAFIVFLIVWGMTAPVSGAAVADGNLQVRSQRQSVQHPYGGVVAKLNIVEGQRVRQGETLLQLTDHEPRAKLDVLKADRVALLAQEARLIAERDGTKAPSFGAQLREAADPSVKQAIANETALMMARERQFEAQSGMLNAKASGLREQIVGVRSQIEGIERQQELLEEEARGARQLLVSGFTPKTRVLALERSAAQLEADRGAKQSEVAAAEHAIGETELNLARTERERISEITSQLKQAQASLAEIAPKIELAEDVLMRTKVTAPSEGYVVGLSIFTEGGVVSAGSKLMDIVPIDEPLVVDGRLQLMDIAEVKQGQIADVRLTSVPRNERPRLRGEIVNVSADKLTDDKSGTNYYSIRVKLDSSDVNDSKVALQAGMPAEIVVTTRPRTLVGYLIGPLADEISGAFREK